MQMGGNIGRGVLDLEPGHDGEVVVLELSSYQTELARALAPDVAVFLNLTPDHLDRHGGIGGYFAAKARLFTAGGPERAVIGVDQKEGRYLANRLREEAENGDPVIRISNTTQIRDGLDGLCTQGLAGRVAQGAPGRPRSICAGSPAYRERTITRTPVPAWAALRSLGLGPRQIEAGMQGFAGLAHRSQLVRELRGVQLHQ